ncbi:sensor histidine kinase [Cryobacterium tepidiphilum]|uniref:histidine kinase n=1 Tax=Cryobacterium tepidiphilum TaxID=2486026 RepID=A0A3M8KV89_9MICO|nr:HAMP domain-containing sensor histidine kinase [Cryobacterium tepidiphilum]RNE56975.1 sensor histidine kinase [Cryobacterium tepidiphilum]
MHESLTERWSRISLRTKITGVTVLLLTLGLLVSGIGTMAMLRVSAIQQLDERLQAEAQNVLQSSGTDSVQPEYFVALYDEHGKLITRTWQDRPSAELPKVTIPLDLVSITKLGGRVQSLYNAPHDTEFHAVAVPVTISSQGTLGTLVLAISLAPTENTMATYLTIFLGFGVGVVIVGALLTRLLVTTTFLPLREVERTAAAIADGDFSQRLGGATPNTEVGRLNRSLNTMLNRIDRAFKDRARTIDQMRRFVGDASHELRTPLVSVRGYAELYRMGALQSTEDVAQAMERIEKEAIRMGGLVEDLLELARLDETKPLVLTPVDLVPLARDAALDAMASSPGHTVTVVTAGQDEFGETAEIPAIELANSTGDLTRLTAQVREEIGTQDTQQPSGKQPDRRENAAAAKPGAKLGLFRGRKPRRPDEPAARASAVTDAPFESEAVPAIVMGEENKIRQVITNLMGNALRFTSADSPIELVVAVDARHQRASIAVVDHGEGIPPQIREKIFQRFWRADTSRTRETGGSGLGLAIVASIVASHNGSVEVLETPGGGATFRVWFPLAGSPAAPQSLAAAPSAS